MQCAIFCVFIFVSNVHLIAGAATNATIYFSYKNKYTANEAEKQESNNEKKRE